jgi:adenylate cyclase
VSILGSTGDQRVTPFAEMEPGVFTHAALVSNILAEDFLARPNFAALMEAVVVGLMIFLLSCAIPRSRAFWLKAASIFVCVAGWSVACLVALELGLKVAWFVPSAGMALSSFGVVFLGYLSIDREQKKHRETFSRYLGADVMEAALESPERLKRGEKREMSVLFSDIRGFTTFSEKMSPEALATFINGYLSPMTKLVFDEKGTLDKYIGDALMAFWNAPLDQADHSLRACRTAVAMIDKLEELRPSWRAAGYPELEIGIGISSGPMVVGEMGSDVRVDYTVLGDAVNLGSRLEGITKEYGTHIIISEGTWRAAKDGIVSRRLGAVRVKGKKEPKAIFELRGVGQPDAATRRAIDAFERALTHWTAGDLSTAERAFREVLEVWPSDPPTLRYLERMSELNEKPLPPDWDGVVAMKTK